MTELTTVAKAWLLRQHTGNLLSYPVSVGRHRIMGKDCWRQGLGKGRGNIFVAFQRPRWPCYAWGCYGFCRDRWLGSRISSTDGQVTDGDRCQDQDSERNFVLVAR